MVTPATDVEEDHSVHDPLALILEEHRLSITTAGTAEVLRPPERGILHEVIDDTRLLLCDGHEVVAVYERLARLLLIVAVTTGIEEDVVGAIDFRVEQVVAFGAKVERRHAGRDKEADAEET